MAVVFKTPSEIASEYLTFLKGLKPEVNINQTDSDWYVKAQTIGGVIAGLYADQRKIADDAFPQSARRDALERHLDLYFGSGFKQPTQSNGFAGVTGTNGTVYTIGTEFQFTPNGNTYQATSQVTINTIISGTTASGSVPIQSIAAGQNQNLTIGSALTITSPPAGSQTGSIALTNISDGRDVETNEEATQRILDRLRFPPAGGTADDYRQFAINADPAVVDANIIRFIFGPGTVGVVVISGTTDIDTALNNGDAIVREPSQALIDIVQNHVDALNPLTDTAFTFGPTPKSVDVTVRVRFTDGNLNTIPSTQLNGQTLTQGQLVIREVQRAIFKTPPGGRLFGASGFVVASEIEENMDFNLSNEPYVLGAISPILADRQVDDLSATGPNLLILPTEIADPGVVNVIEMT